MSKKRNKRGQITIFIIIAIVVVASVAGFFVFKNIISPVEIPADLEPVYNTFLSCIEDYTSTGINLLETQGGYIKLPEFEPGSAYMPFSSQLNFLGSPIPYWYYVSGNNIQKEQVPFKSDMEEDLEDYIEDKIYNCMLDEWYEEGYSIILGEKPKADVTINKDSVDVTLKMGLSISKANESVVVKTHKVSIDSKLGELYDSAKKIYDYEQETLFLENYGVDALRLYAPVDGVEITCSPKVWSAESVFDDIVSGIEANILSLRVLDLSLNTVTPQDKYFTIDLPIEENVRFLTSGKWNGWSLEVNPTEEGIMMAKPVGNHPAMAALGFCYVPYHFVYNINFPVLIQVFADNGEIFQFPFAVVIRGNMPREALNSTAIEAPKAELCKFKNTKIKVNVYDYSLNPVDANISFRCFSERCLIGETENGVLEEFFPQCVNGFIIAEAPGFERTEYYVNSTAQETDVDIFMKRTYEKQINLKLNGVKYNGNAVINFISDTPKVLFYPEQKDINLSEGQYEIQVQIYGNTSIKIPETTNEQCMEVLSSGIKAFFGITEKKCFEVTIPEQEITNALIGGGIQKYYILESELQSGRTIDINVKSLPVPKKIEDIQKNYELMENQGLEINFEK